LQRQNANVTLFARNVAKAQPLADLFGISCMSLSEGSFAGYDLVINTTPVGSGAYTGQSPVTREQLSGSRCVYDLIYNPAETLLLREALEAGCETLGGLEMLVAQAGLQFELWTGRKFSHGISPTNTDLMY